MEKNTKMFVVYSFSMVQHLHELGIEYKDSREDKFNPKRVVFLYENTDELQNGIKTYKSRYN